MEVSKAEIKMMIEEFWSTCNNDYCEHMTILFLRKIGFKADEVRQILRIESREFPHITQEEIDDYQQQLNSYKVDCGELPIETP